MRIRGCRFEAAVREAAANGRWDEALRRHAGDCAACGEVMLVAGALAEWSRGDAPPFQLPDARQLQWRAEWLAAHSAGERAMRPILFYQRFAAAVGFLGLAALAWWIRPAVLPAVPAWKIALPDLGIPFLTPFTLAAGALGLVTLLLALRLALTED